MTAAGGGGAAAVSNLSGVGAIKAGRRGKGMLASSPKGVVDSSEDNKKFGANDTNKQIPLYTAYQLCDDTT